MALIKIFPAFSDVTERNIQADLVGEFLGLNIWFRDASEGRDFYMEIPMAAGSLFERIGSIYYDPYDVKAELEKEKTRLLIHFQNAQQIKDRQINFYTKLWSDMANAAADNLDVPQDASFLISYTKYKIIFGDNASPEPVFNAVLKTLKDKRIAQKEVARKQKERERAEKEALLRGAQQHAIVELKQKVVSNLAINGRELVELSRLVGVGIPIRSQGMFMDQIDEVNSDRCLGRFRKGAKVKVHPSTYYKEIRSKLLEPEKQILINS